MILVLVLTQCMVCAHKILKFQWCDSCAKWLMCNKFACDNWIILWHGMIMMLNSSCDILLGRGSYFNGALHLDAYSSGVGIYVNFLAQQATALGIWLICKRPLVSHYVLFNMRTMSRSGWFSDSMWGSCWVSRLRSEAGLCATVWDRNIQQEHRMKN